MIRCIRSYTGGRVRGILALVAMLAALTAGPAAAQQVTVFAAASTANAIEDTAKLFMAAGGVKVTPVFAASSTLAKQIEQGAPADLFISADDKWMDYLAARKLIDETTRAALLGNRLALVAPADAKIELRIEKAFPLARLLGDGRLATGDPEHVPVGLYAKEALESLGVWAEVAPRLARADSVRAALALVERGEVPFGIVYATDAAIAPKVKVVGLFPTDSHSAVVYPAALVAGRTNPAAQAFLDFLRGPEARAVFRKYGFEARD